MAEVKSYKCDICGEVYHIEEDDRNFIKIIHSKQAEEDEVEVTHYDHVCPDCTETIDKCIDNPNIIRRLKEELTEKVININGFKNLIATIYYKMSPYGCYWTGSDNPELYKSDVEDFIKRYTDLDNRCDKQKVIIRTMISVFVGAIVGNLIGLLS